MESAARANEAPPLESSGAEVDPTAPKSAADHDTGASSSPEGQGQGESPAAEPCPKPIHSQTDLELLEGLRAGSEQHFSDLYNRYFQRIYSFVYTRMRNHADAEEVVQETFTAVFRSFESYRGTSSLLSWIYGIAKNRLNNNLRRAKTEVQRLDSLTPGALRSPSSLADCTPEEHLALRRYARAINDRLESVSSWQSEIFAMRHLQDMSIQEISEATERSSDAIRSSLYRVKRLFFETAELCAASSSKLGSADSGSPKSDSQDG